MSTIGGLFAVWIMNVLWCYFLLKIIPQTGPISLQQAEEEGSNSVRDNDVIPSCNWLAKKKKKKSLKGIISTIPLASIIQENYPQFDWIALIVSIYIMGSITVSFIVMSMGTKHVLDGKS